MGGGDWQLPVPTLAGERVGYELKQYKFVICSVRYVTIEPDSRGRATSSVMPVPPSDAVPPSDSLDGRCPCPLVG